MACEQSMWGGLLRILAQTIEEMPWHHVERGLRVLFPALVLLLVIPSGSVNFVALHTISIGLFSVAALAALICDVSPTVCGAYRLALGLLCVIGLWIVLQSLTFSGNPLANPIWSDAQQVYGSMPQSISVAPGDTFEGLVAALLPLTCFMTALLLLRSEEQAIGFIRFFVLSGAAICAIGLIQYLIFPDLLLFAVKRFYLNTLTTVFVNRNTAATYIGMVSIFSIGLAFHALQKSGPASLVGLLLRSPSRTRPADAAAFLAYAAIALLALTDLMMTRSRGGIAASTVGIAVMMSILVYHGTPSDGRRRMQKPPSTWIRLARIAVMLGVIALVVLLFGGQTILRASVQGAYDPRFCTFSGLLKLAQDHWLIGTGFGTFADVFPAYRYASCGMDAIVTRAHDFYLEGWITLGLPFIVAVVVVVVALFIYLIAGIRQRRRYRWVPAAGLAALLLQMLHNSVDFSIQNPGVGVCFATLTGACIVVSRGRAYASDKANNIAREA